MNGRATLAAMRAVDPEVPVLLMSGHTINEEIQAVLDDGASGFLSKPYSVEMLARSLADAIATSAASAPPTGAPAHR
jgi:DNA-binding NarL/FixJ family response regulator